MQSPKDYQKGQKATTGFLSSPELQSLFCHGNVIFLVSHICHIYHIPSESNVVFPGNVLSYRRPGSSPDSPETRANPFQNFSCKRGPKLSQLQERFLSPVYVSTHRDAKDSREGKQIPPSRWRVFSV